MVKFPARAQAPALVHPAHTVVKILAATKRLSNAVYMIDNNKIQTSFNLYL